MTEQTSKPAILSKTLRFLAAGGLAMTIAIVQEIAKPRADWGMIATMAAGLLISVGGGAYGRIKAQGPVTSIIGPAAGK